MPRVRNLACETAWKTAEMEAPVAGLLIGRVLVAADVRGDVADVRLGGQNQAPNRIVVKNHPLFSVAATTILTIFACRIKIQKNRYFQNFGLQISYLP